MRFRLNFTDVIFTWESVAHWGQFWLEFSLKPPAYDPS